MKKAEFLEKYKSFQLGDLPTEKPNEDTKGLSELVQTNLPGAIQLLKNVDLKALEKLKEKAPKIENLRLAIDKVLTSGGRIFLCGCGATGRLSLLLGFLWREKNQDSRVIAFMAGGDIALVHSLEGFEDYPELGARHLEQLGFTENDLLISCTEGGETPFVIGATEKAAEISKHKPWFLYCNPDEILIKTVERSRKVIENTEIEKICLYVGSMALSGSTRMQASTVLQLAVGMGLVETNAPVKDLISEFENELKNQDFLLLENFIRKEHQIYRDGEFVLYMPRDFAITVFTDTTERSPTFSLPAFESDHYQGDRPSLCYILIPQADSREEAWKSLLLRKPRPLDWAELSTQTTATYLESFDFSRSTQEKREARLNGRRQYLFEIRKRQNNLEMSLGGVEAIWQMQTKRSLFQHTLLKCMLNVHSTLLMGLMGRYQSNMMTWVSPTNAKLVDRAVRYVRLLLEEKGQSSDYVDVVEKVYELQQDPDKSIGIVSKVVNTY